MPLVLNEKTSSKLFKKLTFFEQSISMRAATKIITADHCQKSFLVNCGIPEQKITTILNVANSDIFKKTNSFRTDNEFRLIYHGTISERLGIDLILQAIKIAISKADNIIFYLIGEGEYLEDAKLLIKKLSLTNNVILKDKFVPVEKLPEIISKMDAGIIANRNTPISDYMLPVKLLEYVYMRKPVITPKNKIITSYFTTDMLCFYELENVEEMAEKILFLYRNKEARERFATNALRFTERYNYETEMKKYEAVLKELV
jgi:glycosyltransferase involved in cell wall biosynthesis